MDLYAWQDRVYRAWAKAGYIGVVKVPPRAGKTKAGIICLEEYRRMFPYDTIWIIANSNVVLNQWKEAIDTNDIGYYTYPGAVSKLQTLARQGKLNQKPDLMILDECQFTTAKVWGKVLDFEVPHLLGLSATPGQSVHKLGGIVFEAKQDEVAVADTKIHFAIFNPTREEMAKYDKQSASIQSYQVDHPTATYYSDKVLQLLINRRRQAVYNFKSRIPIALRIIKENLGRRTMCFCMNTKQIEELSKALSAEQIPHCVHYTGNEHLEDFTSGAVDICLTCKKVNIGFNDATAELGILVSTALSEQHLIQTAYRVMTPKEGKHADVYILLADGTSETSASKRAIYIKEKCVMEYVR